MDEAILKKVKAATVYIRAKGTGEGMQGSGFLASRDIVTTNAHVLGLKTSHDAPPDIELVFYSGVPGSEFVVPGTLLLADLGSDLAFVRVGKVGGGKSLPDPLEFANGGDLRETLPVYIFGFPFGNALAVGRDSNPAVTIGPGSVSSLRKSADGMVLGVQLNGNLNPGNSGGPVVDGQGRLVAVSVATIVGTQIGMSIPGERVKDNLHGRIVGATFSRARKEKDEYLFQVEVETLDPLNRISTVNFYWWFGLSGEKRPTDKLTGAPIHGAFSDTERISGHAVKGEKGRWIVYARSLYIPPGKVPFGNLGYTRGGEPERFTAAERILRDMVPDIVSTVKAAKPETPEIPEISIKPEAPKSSPPQAVPPRNTIPPGGSSITSIQSAAQRKELGTSKILQIAAPPGGRALYVASEKNTNIQVADPETFAVTTQIALPGQPNSIWCDDQTLVVALAEPKQVVFVDPGTNTVSKVIPMPGGTSPLATAVPQRILGRAPDGRIAVLCQRLAYEKHVVLFDAGASQPESILKGNFEWGVFAQGGKTMLMQNHMLDVGNGPVSLIDIATRKILPLPKALGANQTNNSMFEHGRGGTRTFSSNDSQLLGVTCGIHRENTQHGGKTFFFSTDLSRKEVDVEGIVVGQVGPGGPVVCWQKANSGNETAQVTYFNIQKKEIERRINVSKIKIDDSQLMGDPFVSNTVFLPNQEILVCFNPKMDRNSVQIIHCRPIGTPAESTTVAAQSTPITPEDPAEKRPAPDAEPPAKVVVGKSIVYTPPFDMPVNVKKAEFMLQRFVKGMTINPRTGTLKFTPTAAQSGSHYISIVADVDGVVVPVSGWFLEIAPQ